MNPTAHLADVYWQTLDFAAKWHAGQSVPGKPYTYVVHLSNVAMEVCIACQHETSARARFALQLALLHDILEDTHVAYAQLKSSFGQELAQAVLALTKDTLLPTEQRMADSLRRILEQSNEVAMVKMADRCVNLQPPPPNWTEEKCRAYQAEAQQILKSLAPASAHMTKRLQHRIEVYAGYIEQLKSGLG